MSDPRVLIPVAVMPNQDAPEREVRLWEVLCRNARAAEQTSEKLAALDDKRLHPTVHLLGPFKRYGSAVKGLWAVKTLLHTHPDVESALRQRRLESCDGAPWVGRIEEHSSDLGLGLALLMAVMNTPERLLAATGQLGDAQDCGVEGDVTVEPVRDVPEKLRALLERKRAGGRFASLRLVFTPCQYYGETGALDRVDGLDITRELRAAGVEVCPVHTFAEAARRLGVDARALNAARRRAEARAVWSSRRRRGTGIAVASLSATALAAALSLAYALTRPVELTWAPVNERAGAQPFVDCADAAGKSGIAVAIPRDDFVPIVPAGSRLSWHVRIGNPDERTGWPYRLATALGYQGYHLALAMFGKTTGLGEDFLVIPEQSEQAGAVQRIQPGQLWGYGWKLDLVPEPTLLMLLVNRRHAFDVVALQEQLRRRFSRESGNLSASTVLEYLRKQADGVISFAFETRAIASYCTAAETASSECPRVQIETRGGKNVVAFPDWADNPLPWRYGFTTDFSGRVRSVLTPDATPGQFLLPPDRGSLYLLTTREAIASLGDFFIPPQEEDDFKGATFLHGPTPRTLQAVRMDGLPEDTQVCAIQW